MRNRTKSFLLALLSLSAGCGPIALQHGARPVGAGKTVAGAGTSILYEVQQGEAEGDTFMQLGQSTGWVRRGFTDRVDAGLQIYTGGLRADAKFALLATDTLVVSVDPGLHLGYETESYDYEDGSSESSNSRMTGADLTMIVGVPFGDGGEIYVAPRFGYFALDSSSKQEEPGFPSFSSDNHAWFRGWGVSAGVRLKAGSVWIIPELGVYQREFHDEGGLSRGLIWAPTIGFAKGF